MLSRYPPSYLREGINCPDVDKEGRVLTVAFEQFTLVHCYAPCSGIAGKAKAKRQMYDQAMETYLSSIAGPVIWTGDLNVTRYEIDAWDYTFNAGRRLFPSSTDWERKSLENTLLTTKLVDAFEQVNTTTALPEYTFYQDEVHRLKQCGLRLDYFFCSPSFFEVSKDNPCPVVTKVETWPQVYGSDHIPLVLTLDRVLVPPPGSGLATTVDTKLCSKFSYLGKVQRAILDSQRQQVTPLVTARLPDVLATAPDLFDDLMQLYHDTQQPLDLSLNSREEKLEHAEFRGPDADSAVSAMSVCPALGHIPVGKVKDKKEVLLVLIKGDKVLAGRKPTSVGKGYRNLILPRGTSDPGESVNQCGYRVLRQRTGLSPSDVTLTIFEELADRYVFTANLDSNFDLMKTQCGELRRELFKPDIFTNLYLHYIPIDLFTDRVSKELFNRMFPEEEVDGERRQIKSPAWSDSEVTLPVEDECDPPVMNYSTMVPYCDIQVHGNRGRAERIVALADSGATYNLTDREFMIKLYGDQWKEKLNEKVTRPRLRLANDSIVSPLGLVTLRLTFGGKTCKESFWVMPKTPIPLILGGPFMVKRAVNLDYGYKRIYATIDGFRTWTPFTEKWTQKWRASTNLYLAEKVTIPPWHEAIVQASVGVHTLSDTACNGWGWICENDDVLRPWSLPWGFTKLDQGRTTIKLANHSDTPLHIRRGQEIGSLMVEWSSKLMSHLR